MTDEYTGVFYGPGEGAGEPCTVLPAREGLEILTGGAARATLSYRGMSIAVTGMDDKYLSFAAAGPDGAISRVLVADKGIASRLLAIGPSRAVLEQLAGAITVRRSRKTRRLAILGAVAAVLAALAVLAWAAFGWAVDAAVDRIPTSWEVELGRATASGVLAEHAVCSDPALNEAIAEIGRRLVVGMGQSPYEWRIRVLDDADVNAFALPGGYVFINRGLVERADSGDEVAGVVAHELQHVLSRHGVRNLVREVGLALIVRAAVGDAGAAQQFMAGNAAALTSMSFSRDQEREADEKGMALIYRAGLEPTGLMRFMAKLAADGGGLDGALQIISTHPGSEDRAADLGELMKRWGQPAVTPLSTDWAAVRSACAPASLDDPDSI